MKRFFLTYILLTLFGTLMIKAQNTLNRLERDSYGNQIDPTTRPNNLKDSTNTEIQSLPPKLYMWHLSETLGNRTIMLPDTAYHHFQNTNLVEGITGHYNYLGNLGSPRLSRIFFERKDEGTSIFMKPYSSFFLNPSEVNFTNSNVPFSNLTYYKGGSKVDGEERFKSYFSVNANKRLAVGFNIDYLYGRGLYSYQSTAHFNAGLFASYIGDHYQLQGIINNFSLKMNENGGITDDRYITSPENLAEGKKQYEASGIPTKMSAATNYNKDFYVYLTHRYRIGFKRKTKILKPLNPSKENSEGTQHPDPENGNNNRLVKRPNQNMEHAPKGALNEEINDTYPQLPAAESESKDSTITEEFVPVTSFIHTVKLESSRHRFSAQSEDNTMYDISYFRKGLSRDSTTSFSIKNVFGIALLEGFNKYAKAGLTAYISHKYSRYNLMRDSTSTKMQQYSEQEVFLGGELAKREGRFLHYNINGEVGLLDKALGQFRLQGNFDMNFHLWKDTIKFIGRGFISNTLPSFYIRHYHSNHFYWDNDNMSKEIRTHVEGEISIERWGTNLRAGVENIKNYTYFNQEALPTQSSDNIQIISATLAQNFRVGIFHLDNEITWQKTSNKTVIPLPQLSLYHNFYLQTKLAKKVLSVQLGADIRYFSKYYAPAYTPAIQQFHLQSTDDQVEIGGYPIVNVYANLHLKRTRFFVMMYHVNQGMGTRNYFLVPHYPINPRLLKIGVSWNFFD